MSRPTHITILGGGIAGLAVGYYAKKNGLPFTIYEAGRQVGGNCVTERHGDFLFDSGAHRFHDKDKEVTNTIKALLGEDLKQTSVPSQIYHEGKFVDFPLSPLNLARNLGLRVFARAGVEVSRSLLGRKTLNEDFESFAIRSYGNTIARLFLLNYSEKLWGVPCNRLSCNATGKRMKGLDLKTFLTEALLGKKAKTRHLDGLFYYPKTGIGTIADRLAEYCGPENIVTNSRVTRILHDEARVQGIQINGERTIRVDRVVSTLPITILLQMPEPELPQEILLLAKNLHYRHLILVALFLSRESVCKAGTVYFPDPDFPFTRVYEPKNRSTYMCPSGKTSLVAEIPCQEEDTFWRMEDGRLAELVCSHLTRVGWIEPRQIMNHAVTRMKHAYPILELGCEEKVRQINAFLRRFRNLTLTGRNGKFVHASIHEIVGLGKEVIENLLAAAER